MSTSSRYEHLLAYVVEHPWAITPPMLATIATIVAKHVAGEPADPTVLQSALVARDNRVSAPHGVTRGGGAIAVIPLYGVIAPRMNMLSDMSGGTTFETLTGQVRAAVADPRFTSIVFDVDSPGGNVAGATEFAAVVREAAAKKPVIAVAHHLMASVAYWAMAGATEIVATPSSMVGSIGVYTIHNDVSEALAKLGIKRNVFSAGRYKAEGADGGPLAPEAQAHVKALVDSAYGRFVADVARGRHVLGQAVRTGFGEGRVLDAEAAKAAGLVDCVATLDDVLAPRAVDAGKTLEVRRQELAQLAMATHRQSLEAAARLRRWH
jgi:signal peptide peptidase SppA